MDYFALLLCAVTLILCGFLGETDGCLQEGTKCAGMGPFDPNKMQESCKKLNETLSCVKNAIKKCKTDEERHNLNSGLAGLLQQQELYCGVGGCSMPDILKCQQPPPDMSTHKDNQHMPPVDICKMVKCFNDLKTSCQNKDVLMAIEQQAQAMNEAAKQLQCEKVWKEGEKKKEGEMKKDSEMKKEGEMKKENEMKKEPGNKKGDATMCRLSLMTLTILPLVSLLWV